ncbi:MAG: nicotinate-nucleotide adenylyltransferase [Kiritimatiellia bacterium]
MDNTLTKQRNIGLLGGSFDPVHLGHLALAREAMKCYALDEVRLLPCAQQALKTVVPASAEDRCAMLRLALAEELNLTLDCREIFRGGITHSYDTVQELIQENPNVRFWFILGMDSVIDFNQWYRAAELLNLCEFIAFDRPGVTRCNPVFDERLLAHQLQGPLIDTSSTNLRRTVAMGETISYSIPLLVERYLRDHRLYFEGNSHESDQ